MWEILKHNIRNNPENKEVLDFLKIKNLDDFRISPKPKGSYFFHEGLNDLWDLYGKDIPDDDKWCIESNGALVNIENGEIYAFIFGRYSFGIKCDFSCIKNTDELRIRWSKMYGIEEDIRCLGDKWALKFKIMQDNDKVFTDAHKKYGSRMPITIND